MIRGLARATRSYSRPMRFIEAGRRLKRKMSAFASRASIASRPAGFFMSRTMLRLLRSMVRKSGPMPGLRPLPFWRSVSPLSLSTLITSAPRSPMICVAYGPMTTEVMSTMRSPASGPAIARFPSGRGLLAREVGGLVARDRFHRLGLGEDRRPHVDAHLVRNLDAVVLPDLEHALLRGDDRPRVAHELREELAHRRVELLDRHDLA